MSNPFSDYRPVVIPPQATLAATSQWHKMRVGLMGERLRAVLKAAAPALLIEELQALVKQSNEEYDGQDGGELDQLVESRILQLMEMDQA